MGCTKNISGNFFFQMSKANYSLCKRPKMTAENGRKIYSTSHPEVNSAIRKTIRRKTDAVRHTHSNLAICSRMPSFNWSSEQTRLVVKKRMDVHLYGKIEFHNLTNVLASITRGLTVSGSLAHINWTALLTSLNFNYFEFWYIGTGLRNLIVVHCSW